MFCSHCGKQLDEGTKFCIFCGNATAAAPAEPQIPLDPQIDLYPEPAPQNTVPTPPPSDYNVYADPKPPVPPKKKGGSKGVIIAIIVILVLLIVGGAGFYLYTQHVYEQNLAAYETAELMLKKGNYDGALDAFLALEDFEDAADRAKDLQELQKAYDEALEMLEAKDFSGALEAFQELGDYRDSRNYAENEVRYQAALYQMNMGVPTTDEKASNCLAAAEAFALLGDYSDAAAMASDCFLEYGMLMLQIDPTAAMEYIDRMDADDVTTLQDAYAAMFDDGAFLLALKEAMLTWFDSSNQYTRGKELELAYAMVDDYHSANFNDAALYEWLEEFQYGLEIMYGSLSDEDTVDIWSAYYLGEYYVFSVADKMYDAYGIFADDPENKELFIGVADLYYAYGMLEGSLETWWENDARAKRMSDGRYYAAYTNDTDYSFNLHITVYYLDSNNNLAETGEEQVIYVAKGATIYIPLIPTTISDSEWSYWDIFWDFSGVS